MLHIEDEHAFNVLTQAEGKLWGASQSSKKEHPNGWYKIREVWFNFKQLKNETGIAGDDQELEYSSTMVGGSVIISGAGLNKYKLLSTGEIVFVNHKTTTAKLKQIESLGIRSI